MTDDPKKPTPSARTMIGTGRREPAPSPEHNPEPSIALPATKSGTLDASKVPEAAATVVLSRTATARDGGAGRGVETEPDEVPRPTMSRTSTVLAGSGARLPEIEAPIATPRTSTILAGGAGKAALAKITPTSTRMEIVETTRQTPVPTAKMSAVEATMLANDLGPAGPGASPPVQATTEVELGPPGLPDPAVGRATTVDVSQQPSGTPIAPIGSGASAGAAERTVALGPATGTPIRSHPRAPTPLPLDYDQFVGQEMCGYTIKRKLAEGGMGVVFEGVHGKIGRRGAIKVLKLEFCRSDEVVERFHQEARAVNSIRHENIVDIYDFGRDPDGRAFFVMEYLEGEPLSARIKRGAIPWSEAFPILEQTLRALKAAHDKGFVHRDLKPDNIWLKTTDSGTEVKLLDFGIAKLVGSESPKEKLTQTGSVMGTPHYMSPEQINGSKDIDNRTDIYAMGVITYEMFAGVTPFVGDTLQAIMTGHLFKEPPRLADIPADLGVPAPIAEIIDRMLAKDAAARYENAADVIADLRDVHKQRQPTKAETLARSAPLRKSEPSIEAAAPKKKSKGPMIGLGIVAVLATGGIVAWKVTQKPAADAPVAAATTKPDPTTPKPEPTKPEPRPAPIDSAIDYDKVRGEAQTTLRASLAETEPAIRVQGSDALGKVKDSPSIPTLTKLTENDPDSEVRGHTADALGLIGAKDTLPLMVKLEKTAPPALKVWYASALARLGDGGAKKRLYAYAKEKDLAIGFKAGLTLADVSQPGDKDAIKSLRQLAAKEAELNQIAPYAGALILTKLAGLKDPQARKILYSILEARDEGARLAAAEGLAKLGDDGGKKVLQDVLANEASPNRLVGAVALIPLGDYTGFDFITGKLDDKDVDTRRLALRALGEIGERKSLQALITMMTDKSWSVRIAAAAAIVAIVGLDPQVLAQASIDWTKSALGSEDWAVRKAAAGVLGDMPEKEAVPLLAQAIADPDVNVRLAASKSAGKMRGAEAATKVAAAAKSEKDPAVKMQQVKALGEIGNAAARETLVEIAADPGKVGVHAAGSLIAVGDPSGKARLDAAVVDKSTEIRLAAVEAAGAAKNPIVVPTLKTGTADRVFDIRFTAAEGLARFGVEKSVAVPVLETGLASKDPAVVGRASSSLIAFGEKPKTELTPAEMLDAADPKVRLAAVGIVRAMPSADAIPLIRRLVGDSNQDVRRAGVEAIETIAAKDKDGAIRLYKPLVSDADAVVRSKAAGQLSRLVEPPPPPPAKAAAVTPDPTPAPDPVPDPPPPDDPMVRIKAASESALAAATEAKTAIDELGKLADEIGTVTAQPAKDDDAVKDVEKRSPEITTQQAKIDAAIAKLDAAAKSLVDAAGASPPPDGAKLVAEAQAKLKALQQARAAVKARGERAEKKIKDYAKAETGDAQMFIATADAAIAAGNLGEAKRDLDKAAASMKVTGAKNAGIDYSYAQLYDKLAVREKDTDKKIKLLQQAQAAYQRFARTGAGTRVQRAKDRATEIAEDIQELGPQ
jgi:serine/threonine protein kinase/HEAT repeat protein